MSINSYTENFAFRKVDFNSRPWHEDDWANWDQLDALLLNSIELGTFGVAGGTANVQTLTFTPPKTAYTTGLVVAGIATVSNTGATTLNVDGLGAKAAVKANGNPLTAGDILSGTVVRFAYDGTKFFLTSRNGRYENSDLAQMPTQTMKGNDTGGTADVKDLTVNEVKALLDIAGDIASAIAALTVPGCVKLSTQTLLAPASEIDVHLTGTYRAYRLIIRNTQVTVGGGGMLLRLAFDGVPTFLSDARYQSLAIEESSVGDGAILNGSGLALTSTAKLSTILPYNHDLNLIVPVAGEAAQTHIHSKALRGGTAFSVNGTYDNSTNRPTHARILTNSSTFVTGASVELYGFV